MGRGARPRLHPARRGKAAALDQPIGAGHCLKLLSDRKDRCLSALLAFFISAAGVAVRIVRVVERLAAHAPCGLDSHDFVAQVA